MIDAEAQSSQLDPALRESESSYRTLFNSVADAIYVQDQDGHFLDVNRGAERMYGYPREILIGKTPEFVAAPGKNDLAVVAQYVQRAFAGEPQQFEFWGLRQNGEIFPKEVRLYRSTFAGKTVVIALATDITERQRSAQAEHEQRVLAEALRDTAALLNSTLDFDQVLQQILDQVGRVVPHETADIVLIDGKVGRIVGSHGFAAYGMQAAIAQTHLPIDTMATFQEMLRTNKPVIVSDIYTDPTWTPMPVLAWARAYLGAPIRNQGTTIGFLNLNSARPNFFTAQHAIRLLAFADQAALALENARLHAQVEKHGRASQARAEQLALLYEAGLVLNRTLEPAQVITHLLDVARQAVHADRTDFFRFDADRKILTHASASGDTEFLDRVALETQVFAFGDPQGLVGWVAAERTPLYLPDVTLDARWLGFDATIHSGLWVAVEQDGQLLGVLVVTSRRSDAFVPADQRLVTLFANQVAVTLAKAQLYVKAQTALAMTTRLYRLSAQTLTATGIAETACLVIAALLEGFAADVASIHIADTSDQTTYWLGTPTDPPHALAGSMRADGLTMRTLASPTPIIVTDGELIHPDLRAQGIQSAIALPLHDEMQNLGVVFLYYRGAHNFADQIELLSLFANQTALAVKRIRLIEETRQRADTLMLINQISAAINQPVELDHVLTATLRELVQAMTVERGALSLLTADQTHFNVIAEYHPGLEPSALGAMFPVTPEHIVALLIRERLAVAVTDVLHDPIMGELSQCLAAVDVRSIIFLPLVAQDRVVGFITLGSVQHPRAFTDAEIALAQTVTHQAATVIEKARLFEAERMRRAELSALYNLSRGLADTDSFDAIMQTVVWHSVEITQMTFARLALCDGDTMVIRAASAAHGAFVDLGIGRREPLANLPFVQTVLLHESPVVLQVDDAGLNQYEWNLCGLSSAQTVCVVPLRLGTHALGVLILGEMRSRKRNPLTAEKIDLVRNIGDQAANAIHRALLHDQTERRLNQVQALHTVDMTITASLDVNVTLKVLLAQVSAQLRADAADILLLNPHTQMLEYLAGHGFRSKAIERARCRLGQGQAGRVALERRALGIADLRHHDHHLLTAPLLVDENFVMYYCVPLIAKGQIKGVLEVFNRTTLFTDSDWLDLLETMAAQAAIAIDNAELFNRLEHSNLELSMAYDATIEGWSRALDLRDKETEGHTQRVVDLTLRLASALDLRESDLVQMRRGALLHDIGKMGIPDSILLKPGALTDVEREVMRRHPLYAYQLIWPIAYLRPGIDIPYCHHEYWDGTGYPRKLARTQIPFAARIFAVVDVWDAITSDRPYRAAWTATQARTYIQAQAGTQFEPRVVEKFLALGL